MPLRHFHQALALMQVTIKCTLAAAMEPVSSTLVQFDAKFRSESARMEKVIKATGMRIE